MIDWLSSTVVFLEISDDALGSVAGGAGFFETHRPFENYLGSAGALIGQTLGGVAGAAAGAAVATEFPPLGVVTIPAMGYAFAEAGAYAGGLAGTGIGTAFDYAGAAVESYFTRSDSTGAPARSLDGYFEPAFPGAFDDL